MTAADDDLTVTDARDEGVIAGRAVTAEDAALAQVLAGWSDAARAPVPSPELAVLLAEGLATSAGDPVVADPAGSGGDLAEVVPLAPRRRRARVVAAGALAAGLLLTGGAAAAAVADGVPLAQVPAEIVGRVGTAVGGALATLGLAEPDDEPAPAGGTDPQDPGPVPAPSGTPGQAPGQDSEPSRGQSSEAPGRSGQVPSASSTTPDPAPSSSGRPTEVPGRGDPGQGDPGQEDPGQGDPGQGDPGKGDPAQGDPGAGNQGTGAPSEVPDASGGTGPNG